MKRYNQLYHLVDEFLATRNELQGESTLFDLLKYGMTSEKMFWRSFKKLLD